MILIIMESIQNFLIQYSAIITFCISILAGIGSCITGAWSWYKFHKQDELNRRSNENNAELQKDINKVSEQQKFENQKRLTEFSLYATKKHEHYIDLYEKLNDAVENVFRQAQVWKEVRSFIDYNREDVEKFLESIPATEKKKKEILKIWDADSNKGCRRLRELDEKVHKQKTIISIEEANDSYRKARLYLQKSLTEKLEEFINDLYAFAKEIEEYDMLRKNNLLEYNEDSRNELKGRQQKVKELEKQFKKIIMEMQSELQNA